MSTDPGQASGDYGYDLVHEEVGAAARPAPPGPGEGPRPGRRTTDSADDLGYDEAHDF